jgi:hypothetical protein
MNSAMGCGLEKANGCDYVYSMRTTRVSRAPDNSEPRPHSRLLLWNCHRHGGGRNAFIPVIIDAFDNVIVDLPVLNCAIRVSCLGID